MSRFITQTVTAIALLVITHAAAAGIVTYDFTGSKKHNALGLATGKIAAATFTISEATASINAAAGRKLSRTGRGLGIQGGTGANSIGRNESLFINFSGPVRLLSLSLFEKGLPVLPAMQVIVDGRLEAERSFARGLWRFGEHAFANVSVEGQLELRGMNQSFRVASVTVEHSVPAPGNLAIVLLGLAAMVAGRNRLATIAA